MKPAFVVSLAIVSYLLATDIYTPSMPEIARFFNSTSNEVQKTMSYFLMGSVISCITAGLLADRVGKKKFLIVGTGLAVMASALTMLCPTIEWLIWGRFLQGLGSGVGPVIGYTVIQELYPQEKQIRIFGMLGASAALVPAIAPFAGGVISTYVGWHFIFGILMVLFMISFICICSMLPASTNEKTKESAWSILLSYREILTHKTFLILALLSPLFNSVEWFYLTFLPFYMQNLIGISAEAYGIIIGILCIWFAVGSYLGSKMLHWYGLHKTITSALYMGLMSAVLLWVATVLCPLSMYAICGVLSFFLLGFGVLFPSSVRGALDVFKQGRTRASSLRSLFITSFAYFGSYSAELVNDHALSSLALYVSICSLLAFGLYSLRKPWSGKEY